jgi:hypothetical protein
MSTIFSEWVMQFGLVFLASVIAIVGAVEVLNTDGVRRLSGTFGNVFIGFVALAITFHLKPPKMTDVEWIMVDYVLDCIFINVVFFITGLLIIDVIHRITKRPLSEHRALIVLGLFAFTLVLGVVFSPEWPL